ncbi:hypothetical protein ACFWYW_51840 [Nonomuraea sp. NPDC059023]|uniref:hypothetical protein n=1 Tax=unclassified Nonomuraea TaxID=2593643 RepID=UPI00369CBE90
MIAGAGAAMCAAGGFSMILAVYPPEERRRVYGYAGAVLGGSLALGPVVAQGLMAAGGRPLVFLAPPASPLWPHWPPWGCRPFVVPRRPGPSTSPGPYFSGSPSPRR